MNVFSLFTLLLHIIHQGGTAPHWRLLPTDTVAMNGGSITLYCALDNIENVKPNWLKREGTDLIQYSNGDIVSPTLCPTSCSITGDSDDGEYHMTLNPVSFENHGGRWMCEVIGAQPPSVEVLVTVLDQSPTCSTDLPTEHKIISGNSVTFTCSLDGAAPPGEMVWMRNNTPVASGNQPLLWTIQIIKENKYDTYDCKYHHDTLAPSPTCGSSIQLDVQYPPKLTVLTNGDIQTGKIKENEEFTAHCVVVEANPDPSLMWTRNGNLVISSATLTIRNIKRVDSGVYKCMATNTFFDATRGRAEESLNVDVQYTPDNIQIVHDSDGKVIETHTFQATCTADSNPSASYVWKNQANDVVGTDATLIMENIKRDEAGEYTCEANNQLFDESLGSESTKLKIDVQYPPKISVTIEGGNSKGQVKEGNNFFANCTVIDANPDPSIVWYKDEVIYTIGGVLLFDTIQRSSGGVYNCTATNIFHNFNAGMDTQFIRIDVQYPPEQPDIVYFNGGKVIEGNTFDATCTGNNGNPSEYTYKWITNGGVFALGQVLHIKDINREQSGNYVCLTSNKLFDGSEGTASTTVEIDVQYLPTRVSDTRFTGEIGRSVLLILAVNANPFPVTFGEWVLGDTTLQKTDTENTSEARIEKIDAEHFGVYSVSAENDVGPVEFLIILEPKGPPEAPGLLLSKQNYSSLTIVILPGFDGGDYESLLYYLEYRPLNKGTFLQWLSGAKDTILAVRNLIPGSVYEFQAYAGNKFGQGDVTKVYEFKTYSLPLIQFDPKTATLTWTLHDNNIYNCVKIEMFDSYSHSVWETIENCIPRHITEFTVGYRNAEYRVTYCTSGGICEDVVFHAIEQSAGRSDGNSTGILAGILTSALVLVIILVIMIIICKIQSRRKQVVQEDGQLEADISLTSTSRNKGVDNPKIYEVIGEEEPKYVRSKNKTQNGKDESNYTDLVLTNQKENAYMGLTNILQDSLKGDVESTYMSLEQKNKSEDLYMKSGQTLFEFPRDRLSLRNALHDGRHHKIVKGRAWHTGGKEGVAEVAVKIANDKANSETERDIVKESYLMTKMSNHPNIVKLLGVCTKSAPTYIIMEYFFQGSLDACLQDIRSSSTLDQRLTERELLSFALDITRGMEHLADLKIVHRYLSPKHVLVDSSLRCKISNFGYASGVIDDKSFYEKGKSSCPERWMAMESFLMTFTEKSDVWSFGVVLWQIASIGDTPYGLMTVDKIQGKLKNGYRLPKPASCGQIAYEEMIDCWKKDPSDRPAFSKLVKSLHALTDNVKEFMDISASRESAYSEVK